MTNLRRRFAGYLVCALVSTSIWPAMASDRAFPFDRELMLDTAPMPGSKRVPIIEIAENGAASIDLWCARARGQASIGGDFDHDRCRTDRAGAVRAGAAKRRREFYWQPWRRSRIGAAAAMSSNCEARPRCGFA